MHINMKFGRYHIVFDGYTNGASIKDHEHQHRMGKTSADIEVSGDLQLSETKAHSCLTATTKCNLFNYLAKLLKELVIMSNTAMVMLTP